MNFDLLVWRQPGPSVAGKMVKYRAEGISSDTSFLEMLDIVNEGLIQRGEEPISFDSDCREGICGACGLVINGRAHGPDTGTATCQLHMRRFRDGEEISVEPWRARAFPIHKDLVVDRSAFDRIIAAGGYISANTGSAPEANATRVPQPDQDAAMDAAACIACGACVAACKNASAHLYVGAKISHLTMLPQGLPERQVRAKAMVRQADAEGFGSCSNEGECEAVCPKQIKLTNIARMVREYTRASLIGKD